MDPDPQSHWIRIQARIRIHNPGLNFEANTGTSFIQ
jgi:hypothetical protein